MFPAPSRLGGAGVLASWGFRGVSVRNNFIFSALSPTVNRARDLEEGPDLAASLVITNKNRLRGRKNRNVDGS